MKKTLWAFTDNRIAVRFEYEWHDDTGQWWCSHGNENWEFDKNGYTMRRYASINDQAISETDALRDQEIEFITPRYTAAEIELAAKPLHQRIAELEARLKALGQEP